MLVSDVQQSGSVIRIHVSILFQILFRVRLLQDIEQTSLRSTVGPCWLEVNTSHSLCVRCSEVSSLTLSYMLVPVRSLQDVEQISLCSTGGPWLEVNTFRSLHVRYSEVSSLTKLHACTSFLFKFFLSK